MYTIRFQLQTLLIIAMLYLRFVWYILYHSHTHNYLPNSGWNVNRGRHIL